MNCLHVYNKGNALCFKLIISVFLFDGNIFWRGGHYSGLKKCVQRMHGYPGIYWVCSTISHSPPQNPHPPAPSSRALIPLCMQKMLSEVPGKVDVYKNTHVVFNFLQAYQLQKNNTISRLKCDSDLQIEIKSSFFFLHACFKRYISSSLKCQLACSNKQFIFKKNEATLTFSNICDDLTISFSRQVYKKTMIYQ